MYECYRGRNSKPELLVTSWPPTRTQEFFSKFEHMLRNFLWDARFFVTSGGDFGVISDNCNAKEHDDIWILRGGRTPFIIRQIEGNWKVVRSTDTFELMGPCYVSGFMNGEKVSGGWQLSSSDDQNQTRWAHGLGMVADIKIIWSRSLQVAFWLSNRIWFDIEWLWLQLSKLRPNDRASFCDTSPLCQSPAQSVPSIFLIPT